MYFTGARKKLDFRSRSHASKITAPPRNATLSSTFSRTAPLTRAIAIHLPATSRSQRPNYSRRSCRDRSPLPIYGTLMSEGLCQAITSLRKDSVGNKGSPLVIKAPRMRNFELKSFPRRLSAGRRSLRIVVTNAVTTPGTDGLKRGFRATELVVLVIGNANAPRHPLALVIAVSP
ncbi:hypothetical protein EVAR_13614_1 [Eumeta japonica]|uniref:Uncharacterized protein n=1 Tax=Eumeta variegata TaxID=151549 RepID=A0A4C1UTA1_EUMVA|nr:hypothetical protein EVAR_13614_1 [Eumeta japonica]